MIISFNDFFLYITIRLFPESVRWCHSAGQNEKALQILRNVAKRNGKKFPVKMTLNNNNSFEQQKTECGVDVVGDDGTYIDLFTLKYIKTTLILCLMW